MGQFPFQPSRSEMSQLDHALQWFDFTDIEQLTAEGLKKQFKKTIIQSHPDRGGVESDFDQTIRHYEYLSAVLKRQMGGRDNIHALDLLSVIRQREAQCIEELNILMNEAFDDENNEFLITFNQEFEKEQELSYQSPGYNEWLKKDSFPLSPEGETMMDAFERLKKERLGGSKEEDEKHAVEISSMDTFHQQFEQTLPKKESTSTTLIYHPEQMALCDGLRGSIGMELIASTPYHYGSDAFAHPEYSDLQSAYTSENTVFDKIPMIPTSQTIDEFVKERDHVYDPLTDHELHAISNYENACKEKEETIRKKNELYFKTVGSSYWALSNKMNTISI